VDNTASKNRLFFLKSVFLKLAGSLHAGISNMLKNANTPRYHSLVHFIRDLLAPRFDHRIPVSADLAHSAPVQDRRSYHRAGVQGGERYLSLSVPYSQGALISFYPAARHRH
jgi:hypothetical protein